MYLPPAFREDRPEVLRDAIRAHPLGTLITSGPAGPNANVLPFTLLSGPSGDVLHAHLARANDQIADLECGLPALVMFQGPHGYVSPSWYPSKQQHGKVVPTWNYVIVEVRGTPRLFDSPEWLRTQLETLTDAHERGRPAAWSIDDAPEGFIAGQLKGIVGLEIPVETIGGKWKVSQNRSEQDRQGVAAGLRDGGQSVLAAIVESH